MTQQNKPRVLIVDDEADFAATLVARLNLRGYSIEMATSGEGAIPLLDEERFDVAILDLRMPDMDGLELLAYIKEHTPQVEVIILTGHGSFETGQEGMRGGAFDYLMKPVDLQVLIEKIDEAYVKFLG